MEFIPTIVLNMCKTVNKMCLNIAKFFISVNYHDIAQLLLLMIIVSSKYYMISIIGKEIIPVNRCPSLVHMHAINCQCETCVLLGTIQNFSINSIRTDYIVS